MSKLAPLRRALILLAVGLVATLTASCGGGDVLDTEAADPAAALAAAADVTSGAESFRMEYVIGFEDVPRLGTVEIVTEAQMTADGLTGEGSTSQPGTGVVEFRMIDGDVFYAFDDLPSGYSWMRMTSEDLTDLTGVDARAATSHNSAQSAEESLARLRSIGEVEEVGDETIDGVATTHYQGIVDVDRIAEQASSYMSPEAIEIARGLFGDQYGVDVWIDDDGFMRQMIYRVELADAPDLPPGMPAEGRILYTLKMSEFGQPVDVVAPPEDEVLDYSDVN